MKNGIYVYGVIKTSPPCREAGREAGDPKEPARHSLWHQALAGGFGEIGIGDKSRRHVGTNVFTIGFKDLAAVVSNSPFIVYDSLTKEKTVKDLVTHQLVIEKIMAGFTIIPVKFGTMVETEDEVIKLMEKGYFVLRNALGKMEGKIELDLVAIWKLPKILSVIYDHNHRVQKKQQEIALKGDKVVVEDKVALGKLIEQALNTRKARDSRLILQALKKKAVEICLHDLTSDEMVFNAAFLIKASDKEIFYKALDKLDQRFEDTLNFRLVGPLPPYSFSTILFKRISQQEVEKAKKTLGLNGEITDKLLSHAYRQLALECHPDKNAGQDQLNFDLVNSAYRVLKDFARGGFFNVDIYHWEEQR
ncbi:GvpL/GvpF family gas vesicle protein [Patescibacteria group bacterium]|nr:GvpL/GvpF family gas vesicle protein [Patescibacteria group bacterium]